MSQLCEIEVAQDARRDSAHVTLRYLDAPAPALCSPEELKAAGFTAVELKEAGCNFSSIKSTGFNLRQLKDAGFQASLFKSDGCSVVQLMEAGFTARELRRAGFDFLSLKSAGFNLKQLKDAGFQASAFKSDGCSVAQLRQVGFTARELLHSSAQESEDFPKSEHHEEIQRQLLMKVEAANIFGQSWMSFLGFFAPFGTENSFWSRLKKSPTFKYVFVYDEHSVEQLGQAALSQELAVARVTVADVDGSVNNVSLVCALLLGIPTLIMGEMSSNEGRWLTFMQGLLDRSNDNKLCLPSAQLPNLYSDYCLAVFQHWFKRLYLVVLLCFYSSAATLLMAVFYYMCRPSESCNCSSMMTLLEAFKIEVRDTIRKRRLQQSGPGTFLPAQAAKAQAMASSHAPPEGSLEEGD
jgi:biotin operon repressor